MHMGERERELKRAHVLRASQVKSLHHGCFPAGASRTRYPPADHVASGEVGPRGRACSAGWERTFQTGADESHRSDVSPHDRRSVVHVPRVENPLSGGPLWTIKGRHASVNAPLRPEVRECWAAGQAVRQVTHISATEAADGR